MSASLKGGDFKNRYVFRARLTARSPLHIGSGEMIERRGLVDEKDNKHLKISGVVVDGEGKPYIPGSTLRGVMRDWLRNVCGLEDREGGVLKTELDNKDADQIASLKHPLERLFGSVFSEGKLEVWDARCLTCVNTPTNPALSGWDRDSLTYVAKSVAIDPDTCTAREHRLYNFELVPEGAEFELTLSGQNMSNEEAGIVLLALEDGFSHPVSPIAIGSMTKRGFGKFSVSGLEVFRLTKDDIPNWRRIVVTDRMKRAGYESICHDDFKLDNNSIKSLKNSAKCSPSAVYFKKEFTFTLETPLVVRSGSSFSWENAERGKTRNYRMKYLWAHEADKQDNEHDIADLYFSLRIEGDQVKPYYHIPSSSIRGSLRQWTIRNLLPEEWWDIEKRLKEYAKQDPRPFLPEYLDDILSLFGFAINTADRELNKKYTSAGRLGIEVEPFNGNHPLPDVHGTWNNAGNDYGPSNAGRHIKTRNPLDRTTNSAKEGGLHSGLEFSKGQSFNVTLIVENPTDFDRRLIDYWCSEINNGIIRFGALSSIGRGRVKVEEVKHGKG